MYPEISPTCCWQHRPGRSHMVYSRPCHATDPSTAAVWERKENRQMWLTQRGIRIHTKSDSCVWSYTRHWSQLCPSTSRLQKHLPVTESQGFPPGSVPCGLQVQAAKTHNETKKQHKSAASLCLTVQNCFFNVHLHFEGLCQCSDKLFRQTAFISKTEINQ